MDPGEFSQLVRRQHSGRRYFILSPAHIEWLEAEFQAEVDSPFHRLKTRLAWLSSDACPSLYLCSFAADPSDKGNYRLEAGHYEYFMTDDDDSTIRSPLASTALNRMATRSAPER